MGRIDFIDDPNAPRLTSVVPSAVVVVTDCRDRVLMVRRGDNDRWALPGGGHALGESITDTAVREVVEETGYTVAVERLTGIYTDPGHRMRYDDGEVRQQFAIVFRARPTGGALHCGEECREVRWLTREDLAPLDLHPSTRLRLEHALGDRIEPYIG